MSVSSPLLGVYDEPEILPYQLAPIWPVGADVRQSDDFSGLGTGFSFGLGSVA